MAQRYTNTHTSYSFQLGQQKVTYVTTRPAIPPAPGVPSIYPTSTTTSVQQQQQAEPVFLDAMIAKKREKARRMRQR